MLGSVAVLGEAPRALHGDLDAQVAPGQLRRIGLLNHLDLMAVHDHRVVGRLDGAVEAAVRAVVFQQVGVGRQIGQVVDGNDFDVVAAFGKDSAHDQAADPPETVDGYFDSH